MRGDAVHISADILRRDCLSTYISGDVEISWDARSVILNKVDRFRFSYDCRIQANAPEAVPMQLMSRARTRAHDGFSI